MAVETLHLDGLGTGDPGTITGASNAYGTGTATWTTNIDNDPWTAHFTLDNPVDPPDATNTVTVTLRARKQDGTDDPSITSVALHNGATQRGIDSTGWTITDNFAGEDVVATISATGLTGDGADLELRVVTTATGGSPAKRSAVQLDYVNVDITTSPAAGLELITLAATTTVTAAQTRGLSFFRTFAATSTLTPVMAKGLSLYRTMAATTTVVANLSQGLATELLAAATTITAGLARVVSYYRTQAATTTMTVTMNRPSLRFIAQAATSTVTAAMAKVALHKRTFAASTTVAPVLARGVGYFITHAAATTVTAGMATKKSFYRAMAATSEMVAIMTNSAGILYQEAQAAVTTVAAALAFRYIARRDLAATTTLAAESTTFKKFYRTMAVPIVKWVVGRLPSGGNDRAPAAILHQDALLSWLHINESAFFDSTEVVGALNELSNTSGVEYDEARSTYING